MTTAIILAGGLGTRLRSAVPDLPKPMAPVAGRPFLAHQMDYWIRRGVRRFVLSVGYRHEVIVAHFGEHYGGADIEYVVEEVPLGTGGGLLLAAERVRGEEPFLLLNGDTYFAVELAALSAFARERDADWCFSLFRTSEEGRYMGMDVAIDGRITDLKSGAARPGRLANGGVYWVNPRALRGMRCEPGQKISLEDDLFSSAMADGKRLFGMPSDGAFIDIGVPDDYRRAAEVMEVKEGMQ
jgi:D-glycero-alpha-D-manno-heptose 1-phosphate guanylyltransferase